MSSQVFVANEMLTANEIGGVKGGNELIEKYKKLSKGRKLSKSQKLAKSRKKLSKSGNLSNFNAKENGLSFLTLDTKIIFNHLWLTFTKAPIIQYFDPEYHIWIETDALSYAIDSVLSQLASEIKPNGVVTKINLG